MRKRTKKRGLFLCLMVLCFLCLVIGMTACREAGGDTETSTDEKTLPDTTFSTQEPQENTEAPTEPVSQPSTQTQPLTEPETEWVTEPETEPETIYDIFKPEVMSEMNSTYYNVMDYGAKGDGRSSDTKAVRDCLLDAYNHNGVAFFPAGEYVVTETITLPKNDARVMKVIGQDATLIGSSSLKGSILEIGMKYNFYIYSMDFEHRGQGSCIDALFLQAKWCRFKTYGENTAPAVVFHGSNCRVIECAFDVVCPQAYSLAYIKMRDEISINDHIVDNVFRGTGMGILVGDGDYPDDGRCEGLKINGNYFYNTGAEQIRVTEILHVNIAHNTLRGGTGNGIVLTQMGHGADGVFINDNDIRMADGAHACIASEKGEGGYYISAVNINNNLLVGGQYGVDDAVTFARAFVRENRISGQSVAGYCIQKRAIQNPYYLFDNVIVEPEGVNSLHITGRTFPTLARNIVGPTSEYPERFSKEFQAGCTTDASQKQENMTRLPEAQQ